MVWVYATRRCLSEGEGVKWSGVGVGVRWGGVGIKMGKGEDGPEEN